MLEQRYICVSDLIFIKEDADSYLLLQIDYLFKLRKVKRIVIFQLFLKEGDTGRNAAVPTNKEKERKQQEECSIDEGEREK